MWLSTTWCDFSVSPPCHGDDVTFPAWCDLSTVLVGLMGFQHHVTMEGQGTQHGGARWSQESCQCHDTPHEVTGKHQHHRASTNTLAGWSGRTPLRHWLLWRWIMEFLEVNPKPSPTKCSWLGIHPYLGHSKLNPRWLVDGLFLVLPHYFRFQDLLTMFLPFDICVYFHWCIHHVGRLLGRLYHCSRGPRGDWNLLKKWAQFLCGSCRYSKMDGFREKNTFFGPYK